MNNRGSSPDSVVETYNIFLNSDDAINNGQNYDFAFGNNIIQTRNKAQSIRLSVSNFNMIKTWLNVNITNNSVYLRSNLGTAFLPFNIPTANYGDLNSLCNAFATATALQTFAQFPAFGPTTAVVLGPAPGIGTTGTNQIQFQLTTTNPHGLVLADATNGNYCLQTIIDPQNLVGWPFIIPNQFGSEGGDSGLLLGAGRVRSTQTTTPSFSILFPTANTIVVTSPYPAQRFTEPNVYVRVNPAPVVLASEGFAAPLQANQNNALNPTTILAEIRVNTELVQYEPPNDRQFFAVFNQPNMGHLQIALTDSRNRALPIVNPGQETVGNRNFTITLRVDILQKSGYLETVPPVIENNTNPRDDSNVLWRPKMGQSNFGRPMGF